MVTLLASISVAFVADAAGSSTVAAVVGISVVFATAIIAVAVVVVDAVVVVVVVRASFLAAAAAAAADWGSSDAMAAVNPLVTARTIALFISSCRLASSSKTSVLLLSLHACGSCRPQRYPSSATRIMATMPTISHFCPCISLCTVRQAPPLLLPRLYRRLLTAGWPYSTLSSSLLWLDARRSAIMCCSCMLSID